MSEIAPKIYLELKGKSLGSYTGTQIALILAFSDNTPPPYLSNDNTTLADIAWYPERIQGFWYGLILSGKVKTLEIYWDELKDKISWKSFVNPLNNVGMMQFTSNIRLNNCYDNSKATSLLEFLSMGYEKRMELKNYGITSETKLLLTLKEWVCQRIASDLQTFVKFEESINEKHIFKLVRNDFEELKNKPNPEKFISAMQFVELWSEVEKLGYLDENISFLSNAIGQFWPHRGWVQLPLSAWKKINWNELVLRDFQGMSKKQILKTPKFGKNKLRALIKILVYCLNYKPNTIREKPLEEQMDYIKLNARLTVREELVLNGRFEGKTLEEIAEAETVTRERIRQIQNKAIGKLRSPLGIEICSSYLNDRQKNIWEKLSQGKCYISKKIGLGSLITCLTYNDKLSLFTFTGEKVKGEAFVSIVQRFLDRRFKQINDCWYNNHYNQTEILAALALVELKIKSNRSPIVLESLELRGFSNDLISFVLQISDQIDFFHGFAVERPLSVRTRRAIDAHIILSDLEKQKTIVSLNELWNLYTDKCPLDCCTQRDLKIVMQKYTHMFFPIANEGWITIGKSRDISQEINYMHFDDTEEIEEEKEIDETDEKVQALLGIMDQLGISHTSDIYDALIKKGVYMPEGSLSALLFKDDNFLRFAPGCFGLQKWIEDDERMDLGRERIVSESKYSIVSSHVRLYIYSRYAGEPIDLYPLWGSKLEFMWVNHFFDVSHATLNGSHTEKRFLNLIESFISITDPSSWDVSADHLKIWEKKKKNTTLKLREAVPDISNEARVPFSELLSALVYIKEYGNFSWARANILVPRGPQWYHSVPCLTTLILLSAIHPAKDWRQKHLALNNCDSLIAKMKNKYYDNPDIRWGNGLEEIIMPYIEKKLSLPFGGWMRELKRQAVSDHFTQKPTDDNSNQTALKLTTTTVPSEGSFQI